MYIDSYRDAVLAYRPPLALNEFHALHKLFHALEGLLLTRMSAGVSSTLIVHELGGAAARRSGTHKMAAKEALRCHSMWQ
jgi:hypothetical protein